MASVTQQSIFGNMVAIKPKYEVLPSGAIKGCDYIYAPKGRAYEYSRLACNPYKGCGNGCLYCWVPKHLRMSRPDFDNPQSRPDFISELAKDAKKYQYMGITEQVLLSFTTDPYNPLDKKLKLTRQTIKILQAHGMSVCILTKGGSRALRDIDLFRPDRDSFATTLTTLDEKQSLKWEPHAALPQDRIGTLKAFYEAGIFPWVSLEPVFDTEQALQIIRETHSFINHFKVGKMNYMELGIDWRKFYFDVTGLLDELRCDYYIKDDLRAYST